MKKKISIAFIVNNENITLRKLIYTVEISLDHMIISYLKC